MKILISVAFHPHGDHLLWHSYRIVLVMFTFLICVVGGVHILNLWCSCFMVLVGFIMCGFCGVHILCTWCWICGVTGVHILWCWCSSWLVVSVRLITCRFCGIKLSSLLAGFMVLLVFMWHLWFYVIKFIL